MKVKSNTTDNYSIRRLVADRSEIISVIISVDVSDSYTDSYDATLKLYPEMLMSGTKTLTREQLIDKLKMMGANISVSVSNRIVNFELVSQTKDINKLLYLFNQLIDSPKFAKSELQRVKKITHNELELEQENSKSVALVGLRNELYKENNRLYSRSAKQLQTDVTKVTTEQLLNLHKKIRSQYWTVTMLGNSVTQKAVEKNISKLVKTDKSLVEAELKSGVRPAKKSLVLKDVPSKSNIDLSLGFVVPMTITDEDYTALNFAISVLAKWGGFAGRLMSTIREKEGLTYGIYGKIENANTTEWGYFRIMTFFAPEKVEVGLTSTLRELKLLIDKGISTDELNRFKNINTTQHQLMYDSVISQQRVLHSLHLNNLPVSYLDESLEKIDKLTKQEVNQAIKKYISLDKLVVSGAGPVKTVEKDIKKLFSGV